MCVIVSVCVYLCTAKLMSSVALTKFYKDAPYWHQTITISLVYDTKDYINRDTLHPVTLKCMYLRVVACYIHLVIDHVYRLYQQQ